MACSDYQNVVLWKLLKTTTFRITGSIKTVLKSLHSIACRSDKARALRSKSRNVSFDVNSTNEPIIPLVVTGASEKSAGKSEELEDQFEFLNADTRIMKNYETTVRQILTKSNIVCTLQK